MQRGKDGHLTLNNKGGSDFFSGGGDVSGSRRGTANSVPAAPAKPAAGATSSVAQQKFGNAKAISSKAFEASQEGWVGMWAGQAQLDQSMRGGLQRSPSPQHLLFQPKACTFSSPSPPPTVHHAVSTRGRPG